MPDNQKPELPEEELRRREAVIVDFIGLSKHISPELREELDRTLPDGCKQAVMALQLLAIQYGRALERKEWEPFFSRKVDEQLNPPKPALQLVATNGQAITGIKVDQSLAQASRDFKASDLLVVPGGQLPPKRG